jgi:prevent-host-death family protein
MDVGVRELKEHLSEFLERAAKGEVIRVTDRGHAKALLGPLPGRGRLDQGIAEGWIRASEVVAPPAAARRVRSKRRTEDALAEDRE